MLTGVLLAGVAGLWLAAALLVCALCVAARRGDRQQVLVDGEIGAARVALDAALAEVLVGR